MVGQIKSIRKGEETKKEAIQGDEVAIAIDGVIVGRQIDEQDVLLVDVPEKHAKRLAKMSLTASEKEILEELLQIHRRDDHFWVDDKFHFQGPQPFNAHRPRRCRL